MNRWTAAAATVTILLIAHAAEAACTTPFFEEETAPASFNRHVLADFDGDGHPEIAALAGADVLLYRGNGTLLPDPPSTIYTASSTLNDIVLADIDRDDLSDLVFSTSTGNVGILFGNGDGTFAGPSFFTAGSQVRRLAVGDFNNDLRPDIFTSYGSGAALFTQDAVGEFVNSATIPGITLVRDVVAGQFNGDTNLDVVATASGGLVRIPGNGNGTFSSPQGLSPGIAITPIELASADVDEDGDPDVVSANDADVSVTVWRNDADGTFGATTYPVLPPNPPGANPRPEGLVIADFNNDGMLDIAAAGTRGGYIAVLTGNADATFNAPSYTILDTEADSFTGTGTLRTLSAADLDGDGRTDLVAEQQRIGLMSILQNLCGLADVEADAPPVISVGQTLTIPVLVAADVAEAPVPTGTVTLKNGATELDTQTVANAGATFEIAGLAAGAYNFTVHYSGDAEYDPAISDPVPVTVTTATSSVSITKSVAQSVWGQPVTFTATVTSTDTSEAIEGTVELFIDGNLAASGAAPVFPYTTSTLTARTHQLTARYLGSEMHPPSPASDAVAHVVNKAAADLQLRSNPSSFGSAAVIEALINLPYGGDATGTIRLFEGSTLRGTIDASVQPRIFTLNDLSMGTHYFTASYSGDSNVLADTSPLLEHIAFPPGGLEARGGPSSVLVMWNPPPPPATQVRVLRGTGASALQPIGTFSAATRSFLDIDVFAGTVYRYQVHFLDAANLVVGSSNIDVARPATFTDDTSLAGKTVRAAHFNEIRDALNALRASLGQAPLSMTFSGSVQAAQVNQLRTAINDARTALGAIEYAWAETISPGVPIRAVPVQQLRDAVR